MTDTKLDAAIEAAATDIVEKSYNKNWHAYGELISSYREVIRANITPVVDEMRGYCKTCDSTGYDPNGLRIAACPDCTGPEKRRETKQICEKIQLEDKITTLGRKLNDLKRMVRSFQPTNDEGLFGDCAECLSEIHPETKQCQNHDCLAWQLREAVKE